MSAPVETEDTTTGSLSRAATLRVLQIVVVFAAVEGIVAPADNVALVVLATLVVLRLVQTGRVRLSSFQFAVLLALVAFLLLSLILVTVAHNPFRHTVRLQTLVGFLITYLAFATTVRTRSAVQTMLLTFSFVAVAISVLSWLHLVFTFEFGHTILYARQIGPVSFWVPRTLGVKMPYGLFGIYASVAVSYFLALELYPEQFECNGTKARILALGGLVTVLSGVYVAQSRSTLFAMSAVFGVVLSVTLVRKTNVGLFVSLLLCFVSFLFVLADPVRTIVPSDSLSVLSRLEQYRFAIEVLRDAPLTGVGFERIGDLRDDQIHNFWLSMGAKTGLAGLFIWIYLFAMVVRRSIQEAVSYSAPRAAFGLIVLATLAGTIVELLFFTGFNQSIGLLLGLVASTAGVEPRSE